MQLSKNEEEILHFLSQPCDRGKLDICLKFAIKQFSIDDSKAANLFRRACDKEYMPGCATLGFLYENGYGVDKDLAKANALYQQACEGGYMPGCNNLGVSYVNDYGVDKDLVKASALYQQACEGGYMPACER